MLRRIGLGLLLYSLRIASVHARSLILRRPPTDTGSPSPALIELPALGDSAGKRYRLHVEPGLPRGVVFGVFTKPFDHGFHEAESGFQLDEAGELVSNSKPAPSAGWMTSRSGRGLIPWGRLGEVALVSSDRAVRIFAKTIPYPITAYDGVCKVSLELADHLGDRFVASGAGFPPGDEVVTELRYSGSLLIRSERRISPEGLLMPELHLTPGCRCRPRRPLYSQGPILRGFGRVRLGGAGSQSALRKLGSLAQASSVGNHTTWRAPTAAAWVRTSDAPEGRPKCGRQRPTNVIAL